MGIAAVGKEIISLCGELTPGRLRSAFGLPQNTATPAEKLPGRPPNMCPGCPHRGVFFALNQLKAYVTGDIGCYTLGFMPPLSAMDTCVCMGASIGMATGVTKVVADEEKKKVVAVIGDSTFLHTGVNGLMDMVYNNSPATVIILDNSITAMTGRQDNPATGFTLMDEPAHKVDIPLLCKALGVKNIRIINPLDLEETKRVIAEEMERFETSVIITTKPCVLIKRKDVYGNGPVYAVAVDACTGCRACLKIGCPAIEWQPAGDGSKKGKAHIDPLLCNGCDVCRQMCKFNAIGGLK
jgi:indolepyruvate ferredoxin oxidoreductase alpha subunit